MRESEVMTSEGLWRQNFMIKDSKDRNMVGGSDRQWEGILSLLI